MNSNLSKALAYIDQDEGPELNISASEPGGSSKHGVSMTVLREWHVEKHLPPPDMNDMRAVDAKLAGEIYAERFAVPIAFDELPSGVDYRLLDIAVNLGVNGALKLLHSINGTDSTDYEAQIKRLGNAWLANKKASGGWPKYGRGWSARNDRAQARALAMLAT